MNTKKISIKMLGKFAKHFYEIRFYHYKLSFLDVDSSSTEQGESWLILASLYSQLVYINLQENVEPI
ncbi:hypothetical protein JCM17380_54820 [Desulfosporosinus burensis]